MSNLIETLLVTGIGISVTMGAVSVYRDLTQENGSLNTITSLHAQVIEESSKGIGTVKTEQFVEFAKDQKEKYENYINAEDL